MHNRFLTSREGLMMQGFPVLTTMTEGVPACLHATHGFESDTFDADCGAGLSNVEPDTERTCRIGQAGNAMRSECVGLMLVYILTGGNTSVAQLKDATAKGMRRIIREVAGSQAAGATSAASASARGSKRQLSAGLTGMAAMLMGRSARRKPPPM